MTPTVRIAPFTIQKIIPRSKMRPFLLKITSSPFEITLSPPEMRSPPSETPPFTDENHPFPTKNEAFPVRNNPFPVENGAFPIRRMPFPIRRTVRTVAEPPVPLTEPFVPPPSHSYRHRTPSIVHQELTSFRQRTAYPSPRPLHAEIGRYSLYPSPGCNSKSTSANTCPLI